MPVRLNGTTGYVELAAPSAAGSNTLTLPTGNGTSGQVLSTNGSGALSWIGAGKILQVVSTTKTDTFSTTTILSTSSNGAQITGLTASITPANTSNKILVVVSLCGAGTNGVSQLLARLYRDSTSIGSASNASNRPGVISRTYLADTNVMLSFGFNYLDSPATTSAVTYSVYIGPDAAGTVYLNRTQNDADAGLGARTSSTITVMEVAA